MTCVIRVRRDLGPPVTAYLRLTVALFFVIKVNVL
jgi:hypothetical protein